MNTDFMDYLLAAEMSKNYLPKKPIKDIFHYTSSNTIKSILLENERKSRRY